MSPLKHLFIEPGTTCSAGCRHCPHALVASRHLHLTTEQIIRHTEGLECLRSVTLVGLGEPFEVPRLLQTVRALAKRGLLVDLTTNGVALRSLDARRLIDSGLARLTVSLDSVDPALQGELRPKRSVPYLLEHIERLNGELMQSRSKLRVGVTMIRTRSTLGQLSTTLTALATAGVSEVLVKNITMLHRPFARTETLIPDSKESVRTLDRMLTNPPEHMTAPLSVTVVLNGLRSEKGDAPSCPYHPEQSAFVTAEGLFYPCYFTGLKAMLGEPVETSAAARQSPFPGFPWEMCRGCSVYGENYRSYRWNMDPGASFAGGLS